MQLPTLLRLNKGENSLKRSAQQLCGGRCAV
jgi:hypothetical protein